MISFGVGLLTGLWLESGFFSYLLSIGAIVIGFGVCKRL